MLLDGTKTSNPAPAVDTANQNQEQQPSKKTVKKRKPYTRKKPLPKQPLNNSQKKFALEWLKDFNATRAAIAAGYSEKTAANIGFALLRNIKIQDYIQKKSDNITSKLEVTDERILKELALIAFSDMANHVRVDEDGSVRALPFDQLPNGASRIVKKIKEKRVIRESKDDKEDVILDDTFEFELHDKLKALELLGTYRNLFKKDQAPTGVNVPLMELLEAFKAQGVTP